jgi:NADPH:quinone reductase-like Zn-dependent oxidoreductase
MSVPRTMKAIRLHGPGVDGLRYETIERPPLRAGEVLVEVHAAAVTRDELEWPLDRLPAVPSYELSGVVAATDDPADVSVGDEVYALIRGREWSDGIPEVVGPADVRRISATAPILGLDASGRRSVASLFDVDSRQAHADLTRRLLAATSGGDLDRLQSMLSEDVVVVTDGGGRVRAALRPVIGRKAVARFLLGISPRGPRRGGHGTGRSERDTRADRHRLRPADQRRPGRGRR